MWKWIVIIAVAMILPQMTPAFAHDKTAVPCGEDGVINFVKRHFLMPEKVRVIDLELGISEYGVGFDVGELQCSGVVVLGGQVCEALRFHQQCWPR